MKDKEMIEKMALIINGTTEIDTINHYCCLNEAKRLYDDGCRIIPKDSVIISKEEYERLNKQDLFMKDYSIIEVLKNECKKTSKETARQLKGRFVDILQEEFYNFGLLDSDLRKIITQRIINEL